MASNYGKKKTLTEKLKVAFRKAVGVGLLAVAVTPFAYWEYGSIKEQQATVTSFDTTNVQHNIDPSMMGGYYVINTDKGSFVIAPSKFHWQNQDDVQKIWGPLNLGKTYRFKTYGRHAFGSWQPNILKATEVTEQDMKAQGEAMARAEKEMKTKAPAEKVDQVAAKQQPAAAVQPVATAQPQQCLSGEMATFPVIVDGYSVQVTVPAELGNKISVNNVRPLAPRPPAP